MGINTGGAEFSVDEIRKDLAFQLGTIDDLDWDYFVETALRAQVEANRTGVNMKRNISKGIVVSFIESKEISVSFPEAEKVGNQRFIEGFVLEIADSIPKRKMVGRTDWFEGIGFKLTLEQAEALYLELGESLVSAKSLISSGNLKIKY